MSRNIRRFIYISLLIHLVGGVTLYMYYVAPKPPQLVSGEQEDRPQAKTSSSQPSLEDHKKLFRKKSRTKESFYKVAQRAKNKAASVQTPSSRQNKTVSKNPQGKKKTQPLSTGAAISSKDSKGISKHSIAQKEQNAQKISNENTTSASKGAFPIDGKEGSQESGSEKSLTKSLETKGGLNAGLKKTVDEKTPSSTPKASNERGGERENTSEESLNTKSNEARLMKTDENKVSGETVTSVNKKEESSVVSREKTKSASTPISTDSSPSEFRDFLDLKQKRGNPKLDYPQEAREKKLQGTVSIIYFVSSEGLVDRIQLNKSSGHSLLDNFVLRTIARYEFLPQQEGWVQHTVDFVLKGKEEQVLKLRDRDE